jgi:hypothetical protein
LGAIGEGNAAFFRGGHIRLKVNIWATHGPNTTKVHGRLMLTVLASMAEFETAAYRIRTSEGRARQAYGQSLGRKLTRSTVRVEPAPQALSPGSPPEPPRGDEKRSKRAGDLGPLHLRNLPR